MIASAAVRRPMLASARWAGRSLPRGSFSALQNAFVVTWKQEKEEHGVRFFCAAAPDPKEKSDEEEGSFISRTFKSVLTPQNQFYALVAGGTVGAYGISRVFLAFTGFFTHLTPTVVAKWGFYTGFGCATMVGGLALVTADNMYIRADPVYRYCLNWVTSDTFIQQTLGDGLKGGSLRSYRLDSGKMEMVGRSAVWRPPRIQMIFDITASGPPYRTGIVTCEAIKAGGFPPRLTTTLLKVDYELGNEGEVGGTREEDQTHFLKGSKEEFTRVSKRSGLSLDSLARAVHIEKAAAGRHES